MGAPDSAGAGQAQGYISADSEIIGATDADRKVVKNARALAACDGCELYELAAGGFLLTRAGMTRELPDVRAVLSLLQQLRSL
jgi:hypothetical protein